MHDLSGTSTNPCHRLLVGVEGQYIARGVASFKHDPTNVNRFDIHVQACVIGITLLM
jgi:hypothetical protein